MPACREPGWAGVALAPGQPSQAAVARHFAKDVTLFDGPMAVQTIHTLYRPTAVQLLSTRLVASPGGGPLVAVAEGPQLSIWDVRGSKRGGRVAKLCPGPYHGHLYCIAAADDGGLPLIGAHTARHSAWSLSSSSCSLFLQERLASQGGSITPDRLRCCASLGAGAAGHERSVLVWEPRKWVLLDRWSNCLKYEATGMHFCSGGA